MRFIDLAVKEIVIGRHSRVGFENASESFCQILLLEYELPYRAPHVRRRTILQPAEAAQGNQGCLHGAVQRTPAHLEDSATHHRAPAGGPRLCGDSRSSGSRRMGSLPVRMDFFATLWGNEHLTVEEFLEKSPMPGSKSTRGISRMCCDIRLQHIRYQGNCWQIHGKGMWP